MRDLFDDATFNFVSAPAPAALLCVPEMGEVDADEEGEDNPPPEDVDENDDLFIFRDVPLIPVSIPAPSTALDRVGDEPTLGPTSCEEVSISEGGEGGAGAGGCAWIGDAEKPGITNERAWPRD